MISYRKEGNTSIKFPEHKSLITNLRLIKMNMKDPFCVECIKVVETIIHVLKDWAAAKRIWCSLVIAPYLNNFLV